MAKSKDVNELLHMWQQWHEETGRPLRSKFIRYVQLSNEAARLNGNQNKPQMNRLASALADGRPVSFFT